MAFFRIDYINKISWPQEFPINSKSIIQFIDDYLTEPLENLMFNKSIYYIFLKFI